MKLDLVALKAEYARLQSQLARVGWISHGYVQDRGPGAGGRCYQWTRKERKKTVSVALSKEQFEAMKQAIENWRQIQETPRPHGATDPAVHLRYPPRHSSSQTVVQESFRPYLSAIRVLPDNTQALKVVGFGPVFCRGCWAMGGTFAVLQERRLGRQLSLGSPSDHRSPQRPNGAGTSHRPLLDGQRLNGLALPRGATRPLRQAW